MTALLAGIWYMDDQQAIPQSVINRVLRLIAVDACAMLRQWSDSSAVEPKQITEPAGPAAENVLTPHKIGIFQDELEKQFAAVYYGTHDRLVELGDVSVRPISPKRGVWIEFAEDGQRVTDILHDRKDAVVPDGFVWCEESC